MEVLIKSTFRKVVIFLLVSTGSYAQIQNTAFEEWDTLFYHPYQIELEALGIQHTEQGIPTAWETETPYSIARTSDSFDGESALMLHHWYHYLGGDLHQTIITDTFYEKVSGYFKLTQVPASERNQDLSAHLTVRYTRNEGLDTIASGTFNFTPTEEYTFFELVLIKDHMLEPEEMQVEISSIGGNCGDDPVCNFLYIDHLAFSRNSTITVSNDPAKMDEVKVFPNPVRDQLHLNILEKHQRYKIYDTLGRLLIKGAGQILSVDSLSPGNYFLLIELKEKQYLKFPFVKQ